MEKANKKNRKKVRQAKIRPNEKDRVGRKKRLIVSHSFRRFSYSFLVGNLGTWCIAFCCTFVVLLNMGLVETCFEWVYFNGKIPIVKGKVIDFEFLGTSGEYGDYDHYITRYSYFIKGKEYFGHSFGVNIGRRKIGDLKDIEYLRKAPEKSRVKGGKYSQNSGFVFWLLLVLGLMLYLIIHYAQNYREISPSLLNMSIRDAKSHFFNKKLICLIGTIIYCSMFNVASVFYIHFFILGFCLWIKDLIYKEGEVIK
ncbi:MAG: hypothetical protein COB02_08935 [Candidatus Cloacimonadota bacterium]|nr:MAG: hypothetical protein COB02_08935 [Candidatus Cloacimonadota bacterium]